MMPWGITSANPGPKEPARTWLPRVTVRIAARVRLPALLYPARRTAVHKSAGRNQSTIKPVKARCLPKREGVTEEKCDPPVLNAFGPCRPRPKNCVKKQAVYRNCEKVGRDIAYRVVPQHRPCEFLALAEKWQQKKACDMEGHWQEPLIYRTHISDDVVMIKHDKQNQDAPHCFVARQ